MIRKLQSVSGDLVKEDDVKNIEKVVNSTSTNLNLISGVSSLLSKRFFE